ncbi:MULTISPECIES: hypothetical protein [Actinomadura]|uniref:Uncharacterized protein n=1 Tax=Actinomadura geliboluensis TaxID=882440 RepID=A0A5S4HCJ1_9ACTN|nr:hypothetical protein [Actinomadura geliboluensis]TMR42454.1 hypothetical protein ETD96_00120 [Actinomadura geliboluensis]
MNGLAKVFEIEPAGVNWPRAVAFLDVGPGGASEILRNVVAERAKADQIGLGTPRAYRARLADLVGL